MRVVGTIRLAIAMLCTAASGEFAASGATSPVSGKVQPAIVSGAVQTDFTSVSGRSYRLFMAMPAGRAPPEGWPVIYVLDGNAYFASVADAVRVRSLTGDDVKPAVVVGIGYPTDDIETILSRRALDFSPTQPSPADQTRNAAIPYDPAMYGGADAFLRTIRTEIMPWVASRAHIDNYNQTIFGHSLGGLFVIDVLLKTPETFTTYVALSPSLWWGDDIVLETARRRILAQPLMARRTLYLAVGGREQRLPDDPPDDEPIIDRGEIETWSKMRTNARTLADLLAPTIDVTYAEYPGDSHLRVPWSALGPALQKAIPSPPSGSRLKK